MLLVISLLAVLIILCGALFWLKLEIGVIARKDGTNDQINVVVGIPPFLRREISVPVVELVEKHGQLATRLLKRSGSGPRQESVLTLSEQRQVMYQLKSLLQQIRQKGLLGSKSDSSSKTKGLRWIALGAAIFPQLHITVKELYLSSRIGLGDAAVTGIGIGLVWSLLGACSGLTQQYLANINFTNKPQIKITPEFGQWLFQGRLRCIVSLRLGEIILEGVKHLVRWQAFRRDSGGRTTSH